MDLALTLVRDPIAHRWSLTLVHFLWQGAVVVAVTGLLLSLRRGASPNARYAICLSALVAVVVAPVLTFFCVDGPHGVPVELALTKGYEDDWIGVSRNAFDGDTKTLPLAATFAPSSPHVNLQKRIVPNVSDIPIHLRAWTVVFWITGQSFLAARFLLAIVGLWLLKRGATAVSDDVSAVVSRLSKTIGIARPPTVFSSDRCHDAAAAGLCRPWIVVPSAWLVHMSPEMLEAVIAHELFHIRRYDPWVNAVQRLAENVLFFHPAVWWLSRRISDERELCCDAAVVGLLQNRRTYARTLEFAARHQVVRSTFLFAIRLGEDRMSLLNRVQFVLHGTRRSQGADFRSAILAVSLVALSAAFSMTRQYTLAEENTPLAEHQGSVAPNSAYSPTIYDPTVQSAAATQAEPRPPLNSAPSHKFSAGVATAPPTELTKVTLPDYVIEPPDILLVEAVKLILRDQREVQIGDQLQIVALGVAPEEPIGGKYQVESDGRVNLGDTYGSLAVAGKTIDQVADAVERKLRGAHSSVQAAVSLTRVKAVDNLTGEHLVGPDGTINLGRNGRVYVAGKTLDAAQEAIEDQLANLFVNPQVAVDVFVYNSKFFYVILEGWGEGSQVHRMPVTGNETVLDAIAQLGGLEQPAVTKIWVSRPAPAGRKSDQILPVDWDAITRGASTATNYQLLTGDRLFLSSRAETNKPHSRRAPAEDSPPEELIDLGNYYQQSLGERANSMESQLRRYNKLVEEGRYEDAMKLAATIQERLAGQPIAQLISQHAKLVGEVQLQRKASDTLAREAAAHRQRLAAERLDIWREHTKSEWQVRERLRKTIEVNYDNAPLEVVLKDIGKQVGLDIVIDKRGLAEEGVTADTPISMKLTQSVSVRSVLNLILEPLHLEHVIEFGVLKVTSHALSAGRVYAKVYAVGDILPLMRLEPGRRRRPGESDSQDYDRLIQLITGTVSPDSWSELGGPGAISPFPANASLVIGHNRTVHGEIAELLDQVRRIGNNRATHR